MNISDLIVKKIVSAGTTDIFGYPGSLICFFMDAIRRNNDMKAHLCRHEQACGFAATGYARVSGKLGACYATSGPGASNLITAIAHAYYESIPVIFITGQVHTNDLKRDMPVRQNGNQEYDIVAAVRGITKYAVLIDNADSAQWHIEKAIFEATNNRPGPVLLDLPVNVSQFPVDETELNGYAAPLQSVYDLEKISNDIYHSIAEAKNALILAGQGVNQSRTREELREFARKVNIPVVTSMSAVDITPNEGFIGANGNANKILDDCDLLVSFGCRINVRHLRGNQFFNSDKKLIRIDIDEAELSRDVKPNETKYHADLRELWKVLLNK